MRFKICVFFTIIVVVVGFVYFLSTGDNSSEKNEVFSDKNKVMFEAVKIKAQDGIEIAGDYYDAPSDKGVILLHMMPADRKSWIKFALKLQTKNFKVLAIDLRGHGESQGGPDGYKNFSDIEHQSSSFDVEAAVEFLENKGAGNLYLAGASIGANLALKYLAEHSEAKSVVLLSPGLDYRGVKTVGLVKALKDDQAVFAVASEDDKYSFDSINKLFEGISLSDSRMIKIFKDAGHGTTIFERKPEFMDEVVGWLMGNSL